ncbi:hypothetical protein [Microcoleus sp. Pol10D4]|uniref:hypothetical protein n=1 Tax=Microcoleus sp. Pol10D4 TaxID=3055387 RepID=UPI002FD246B6
MAKSFAIVGGMVFLLLSIAPIPTKHFALLRTVAAGIGGGVFTAGYCVAKADEKREQEIATEKAKIEEDAEFEREQAFKDKLAIAESQREVLVIEAKQKEAARIQVAIADYVDDVRDAYIAVQDGKGRLDRCSLSQQRSPDVNQPSPDDDETEETEAGDVEEPKVIDEGESFAAKKAKLIKLIEGHEGSWIGQLMQKPLLVYGDMGSFKGHFVGFLSLCRYYLRGHQIFSIADPHFHQNEGACWKYLLKLGVPGYGAHHNYKAVGEQLEAMYARFATRTLKDKPYTSIWDEVTGYAFEEGTKEPAKKLIQKVIADPRKANECPILIGHANTLASLGGSEGFSKSRDRGIIQLELYSDSENKPLFKGTLSGIKNADGEFIDAQKVSIAAEWIRPEWVYNLFNSGEESVQALDCAAKQEQQFARPNNRGEFLELARKWLNDVYEVEVENTSDTTPWDEVPEVRSEVEPEVREVPRCKESGDFSSNTSILPEDVRSTALSNILRLLSEVGSASDEVIRLIPVNPDMAVWRGIQLLGKSVTAVSRDIFNTGTGGAKFNQAKFWYEELKKLN